MKIKNLESNNSEFSNDLAVGRLENLLAKEEGLRRQIEISAREAKSQLEFEKTKNNQLSENIQALTTQLKSVTTERNCMKNQLSKKGIQLYTYNIMIRKVFFIKVII